MPTAEAQKKVALKNVLFATDFSACSDAALPFALALAQKYTAKLYLSHVVPLDAYALVASERWPSGVEREEQTQKKRLQYLETQLQQVPHEILLSAGDVWQMLARQISDKSVDLVVMGTHGRAGARRLLMGSVAERIFRQAPCPVLMIGPHVAWSSNQAASFEKILLATDFGPASVLASHYAVSLAQEHQAELELLHILEEPEAGTVEFHADASFLHQRLRELVPTDTPLPSPPQYFVEFGPRAEKVLHFATERGVDLIVLGVHKSRTPLGIVTHMTDTTAQHIVANALCPVLTVRGPVSRN